MTVTNAPHDKKHVEPEIGWISAFFTYFSYAIIISIGHIRDFFATLTGFSRFLQKRNNNGYAVLFKSWESFYTRRLYHRISDCWNRPIASSPGAHIEVIDRISHDGSGSYENINTIKCLNLGSYNYLGFADDWKSTCGKQVLAAVENWPLSMCSSRADFGTTKIHEELEQTVAKFVGKEAAIVYTMGYGTNLTSIPCLLGQGTLLVSDSLNHTSLVNGARSSNAFIRVFRHNDPSSLDEILREAVVNGQPRFNRPWKKIVVLVEGIYSMEGAICKLDEIVKICKKYKAYIYVDEAHSIGALGRTGRGVCEYRGVNPDDIDILMGTFTKSFSGMGGYVAASKRVIDYIRSESAGVLYHNSLSPIVATQILTAFRIIMGLDGTNIGRQKLDRLVENANFFRSEMERLGLHTYGDYDEPIIPVLIYLPSKIAAFSRECLKRGLAVVVVGFPATSVILSRTRFCISAGHTREDLEFAVKVVDEVTELLCMKYNKGPFGI
jgi:serine palmitoyltransferase